MTAHSENTTGELVRAVAAHTSLREQNVLAVIELLDEGATVPFIARYRKERTGALDEVAVTEIRDQASRIRELFARRDAILASCAEQGVLTDALEAAIREAGSMSELEDVYLPYRPKRKTRASIAREKGLEGLAVYIMKQARGGPPLHDVALAYVSPAKGVNDPTEALAGARDIIAEAVSEHRGARARMRALFFQQALIAAAASGAPSTDDAEKFRDYYDSQTRVQGAPAYRIHALLRGERTGALKLKIRPDESAALGILHGIFVKGSGEESRQVELATGDCYKRLLAPSMETELRAHLKERADTEAIRVFTGNLRAVLMASPYGEKKILAVDPGFKSGCKVVALDATGRFLEEETVYPHPPQKRTEEAGAAVLRLVAAHEPAAIAVGNGTAGRETVSWLRTLGTSCDIVMVSEQGASVYSASPCARAEFPTLDLTLRGAISIGRRFQDPLAELVKIEPRSIGVGQYQHDVEQKRLHDALDDVVISCVNQVGVDVNSASPELLRYVSGLSASLAANIVKHREEHGPFQSRRDLHAVPRLGPKAFEQSAGFLRIRGGSNPLDASAVHPENYAVVHRMASDLGCRVADLMQKEACREKIVPSQYEEIGAATLADILAELAKPGRDPRQSFEPFAFVEDVRTIEDLKPGMQLPGIVSNVTDFGAFVDIGVHQDGLLHKSKMPRAGRNVIAPGRTLSVEVIDVDTARRRISLGLLPEKSPS